MARVHDRENAGERTATLVLLTNCQGYGAETRPGASIPQPSKGC